jgi:hypothetical protein
MPEKPSTRRNGRAAIADGAPIGVPAHIAEAFDWFWLVPNDEDRKPLAAAFDAPLAVGRWRRANLSSFTAGEKLILIIPTEGPLHEAGIEAARECWKTAKRVVIWELPALGLPGCPNLATYAADFDLAEEIEWARPWTRLDDPRPREPKEEAEDAVPIEWGELKSLATPLAAIPRLDPELIPVPFRAWLADIAERGCFPPEFGTAAAIVMLAAVAGRKVGIRPKREDDWLVIPNLWGAIVGHSGLQKSPPAREAMYPVKKIAAEMRARHRRRMEEWEAEKMVAGVEQAIAKAKIRKAAERGFGKRDQLQKIAADANKENSMRAPVEPRLLVNDVTVPRLAEIHANNPNGLILFRDELIGFLRSMDMQGHESDRGFFLEAWNGNGEHVVDRIGRGQTLVPHCCVSMFGTIQPGPLAKYLRGTFRGEEADGFVPRFQILLYPDPPPSYVNIDRQPDHVSRDIAYAIFRAIFRFHPRSRGCEMDKREGTAYLHFSEDAQACFDSWRETLENRLRNGSTSHLFASHLSKYRSLFPSLALLFHLVDYAGSTVDMEPEAVPARPRAKKTDGKAAKAPKPKAKPFPPIGPVSLQATELAARWCALLEAHARRVYLAAQDGDPEGPTGLAERITVSLPNPFTIRDVQRKGWSGLTSPEEIRRAVGILEDRGWVHATMNIPGPKGGRPGEAFFINPALSVRDPEKP